jgi:molybdopterin-containing oxidoreductase family iron-sulfur binding subunit
VIEKCSFCVQRLQAGKLEAKKESRPLETGHEGKWDVKTACQQACPTSAIVFGNVNDKNSEISKVREGETRNLVYHALDQLHVLPSVSYLAKIRNTDREVGVPIVEHVEVKKEVKGETKAATKEAEAH